MCFKPRGVKLSNLPIVYLSNQALEYKDSLKYLGVFLSSNFTDDEDVKRQIKSLYCKTNILIRKFYNCSYEVKIKLFQSFCSGMYCCQLWS